MGIKVSFNEIAIIETNSEAKIIGRKIRLKGTPKDFKAINSLPDAKVDMPNKDESSDDIGSVKIITSGSL